MAKLKADFLFANTVGVGTGTSSQRKRHGCGARRFGFCQRGVKLVVSPNSVRVVPIPVVHGDWVADAIIIRSYGIKFA